MGLAARVWNFLETRYVDLPPHQVWYLRTFLAGLFTIIRSITPLAGLTLFLLFTRVPIWSPSYYLIAGWCSLELLFYSYIQLKFEWYAQPRQPAVFPHEKRIKVVHHLLNNVDNIRLMMVNWLLPKPTDDQLHFGYFVDWIINTFFTKPQENLTKKELQQAQETLDLFEAAMDIKRTNLEIPSDLKDCVKTPMEPLKFIHKPLIFYTMIAITKGLGHVMLTLLGFQRYKVKGLLYWSNQAQRVTQSDQVPILFIHGVGTGLSVYCHKLHRLQKLYPGRPIFLLEIPYVSLSPFTHVDTMEETLVAVDTIMDRHQLNRISLVGHSYGTIIASWIVQHRPHYLTKLTLIDPVCFMLWDAALIGGFLYHEPNGFFHELIQFFVVNDPTLAIAIRRYFWWYQNLLLIENLTVPTKVYYSRQDWMIDAKAGHHYLLTNIDRSPHLDLTSHLLDLHHGGYLLHPQYGPTILAEL